MSISSPLTILIIQQYSYTQRKQQTNTKQLSSLKDKCKYVTIYYANSQNVASRPSTQRLVMAMNALMAQLCHASVSVMP